MASSGKLARSFAEALGVPEATGTTVMKALREAGMVSRRGRGTSAANMTRRDAAMLLAATASGAVSSQIPAVTNFLLQMPVVLRSSSVKGFAALRASTLSKYYALPKEHYFGDALLALLESSWDDNLRDSEGNERGPAFDPLKNPSSLSVTIGMNGMKTGAFAIVQAQVAAKQTLTTYYSTWQLRHDPQPAPATDILNIFETRSEFLSIAHLSGRVIAAAIDVIAEPIDTTRKRAPKVSRAGRV